MILNLEKLQLLLMPQYLQNKTEVAPAFSNFYMNFMPYVYTLML